MKSSKAKTTIKSPATPDALAKGKHRKGSELNEKALDKVSGGTASGGGAGKGSEKVISGY